MATPNPSMISQTLLASQNPPNLVGLGGEQGPLNQREAELYALSVTIAQGLAALLFELSEFRGSWISGSGSSVLTGDAEKLLEGLQKQSAGYLSQASRFWADMVRILHSRIHALGQELAALRAQVITNPPLIKHNTASSDPTVNDDSGDGYRFGSVWHNSSTDKVWICLYPTLGAAVWMRLGDWSLRNYAVQDHAPEDGEYLKWVAAQTRWEPTALTAGTLPAHKDNHDPNDGADPLDTAAPAELAGVQASGVGTSHSLARADHVHQIQASTADDHLLTVDSADVASGEYARFTANGLESRTIEELLGEGSVDDLSDVDTSGASLNKVLKWDGTNWVPGTAGDTEEFTFGIATFDDGETATQLIGTGTWRATGTISFTATYDNGPPDSASIALSSDGGVTWGDDLDLISPYTSGNSAEDTDYPSTKDKYVRFTLTATKDAVPEQATATVYFRNLIYWGVANKNSGFSETDVEALAYSEISNDHTRSMSLNPGVGEYMVFAHPSSYNTIPGGDDYEVDGGTGFQFNNIACAFSDPPETVSITNSAGYVENYKVYASNEANLGNHTLVTATGTSSTTINPLYYGKTTKTSGYTEADVESLANAEITNDNTQEWDPVTTGSGEYMLFAFPKRLGIVVFYIGGFAGGFQSPEEVSVTNSNGWSELYYVWRSTNPNLGEVTVETKVS